MINYKNITMIVVFSLIALSIAAVKSYYKIDPKECTNCGACVQVCKDSAITITTVNKVEVSVIDPEKCTACGSCEPVCAVGAISLFNPEKEAKKEKAVKSDKKEKTKKKGK